MKTIIPCGENTLRWMEINKSKKSMLEFTIDHLSCPKEDVIVILTDKLSLDINNIVLHKNTYSQPETIAEAIKQMNLQEDFFVKDVDSSFEFNIQSENYNYICVESLHNFDQINCNNKSYIVSDHNQNVIDFKEGLIVSDLFSAGGYYFTDAREYLRYYNELIENNFPWSSSIFLSDIFALMILAGKDVRTKRIKNYQDYGDIKVFQGIE